MHALCDFRKMRWRTLLHALNDATAQRLVDFIRNLSWKQLLHALSGGAPLYIELLAAHLREDGGGVEGVLLHEEQLQVAHPLGAHLWRVRRQVERALAAAGRRARGGGQWVITIAQAPDWCSLVLLTTLGAAPSCCFLLLLPCAAPVGCSRARLVLTTARPT